MGEGEKTEKATPKRRRDERKKGNIFFSNDAVSVVVLLAGFFTLRMLGPWMVEQIYGFFRTCINAVADPSLADASGVISKIMLAFLETVAKAGLPLMAVTAVIGVGVTLFQTQMLVSGELIKPQLSRLNPLQGIKKLFSLRSVIEALKGILKIIILLYLIYNYISGVVGVLGKYFFTDLRSACSHLFDATFSLVIQIGIAFVVLAAADIFYQKWEYERKLRMSKQEIKEEYKQTEGDPKIKGKIKEAQRKLAQSRMMQKVPGADVVIRNPTHFAVALRYKPDVDNAPIVLAKGQDEMALRIVRLAEENHVAVVENVPLARALYASADLNQEIPVELYNAVAEVLVYIYRMDKTLEN